MRRNVEAAVLTAILAGTVHASAARADIFVWTDAAGVTNVSNLPPPEGSRSVSVTRSKPMDAAQEAALREAAHQAELRALNERLRQTEAQAEQARRDAAQAIATASQLQQAAAPAAPAAPVVVVVAPSAPAPSPPAPPGPCDYAWAGCGWGFWPGFFSPGVVLVDEHRHRRHHRPVYPGHSRNVPPFTAPPAVYPYPSPKPVHWRK